MKFSTKMSLITAVMILASFCAMAYLGHTTSTRMLEERIKEQMENTAFHSMDKIDRTFFERYADMKMMSTDTVLCSRGSTPKQITERLAEYQRNYKDYSSLSFFDLKRIRIADTGGKSIGAQHALTEYWPGIEAGEDFVMIAADSRTANKVVIYFAVRIKDNKGRPFGVVAARMPIDSIYAIAEQAFTNPAVKSVTRVEMLDRDGVILYSNYNPRGMLKDRSGDWQYIKGLLTEGRNTGSARHDFTGEDEITAFARGQGYAKFKGNGWVLVLCTPVKTAFAPAYDQNRKFMVLFSIILVVVLSATFLVSRAATKTLHELGRAALEIGKGNLDATVEVKSKDEIGELAKAFNAMTRDLRDSEKRYKDLAELLPQIVFEVDARGMVVFVNRRGLDIFGYSQQDLEKGLSFLDVFVSEEHARLRENLQKRLGGEANDGVEYTAVRRDGSTFPFLVFTVPIRRDDKVLGIRGIGIDISERRKAEQELQKFASLIENSLDFIGIASLDGKVLYLNSAARNLVGLDRDAEATSKRILDFYFDEDISQLQDKMAGSSFWRGEFRLRHFITHASIPVEMTGFTITDMKTGRPIALATVMRDITERKQREKELRESEEKLRRITDTARDAIVMMDDEGRISFWNPAAEKIFGYSSGEARGKELHASLTPVRHYEAYQKGFERFRQTGEGAAVGRTLELDAVRKDGAEFKVELSLSSIHIKGKWHAVGVMRDITERKQAEETIRKMNTELELKVRERTKQLLDAQDELVRKEKLATLGQLAGTVGHELRNPLGVMNNAVYFLQTVLADADETTKEYLGLIKSEIAGAERIVSDLLDAVRTKPPHPQRLLAEDLIRMILEKCRIPERVTVEVMSATRRSVLIDPLQMKQAFINIINNAVDAMPEGGTLKITADEEKNAELVRFAFKDEGVGISSENVAKLFQPLFTTKARGIGLGLVVVKNLTEANGGRVDVESEPGKGTTFTITLPTADAKMLQAQQQQ